MEGEAKALLDIAAVVVVSMTYARYAASQTQSGAHRFLLLLPVILLLPFLPRKLASIHFRGIVAFFLVWLGVFKLVLLSFSLGPLSSSPPLPLLHFLALSSLPVKPRNSASVDDDGIFRSLLLPSLLRLALFLLLLSLYQYESVINPYVLVLLYCFHLYLMLELLLSFVAVSVRVGLGLDLEPQFDAPYKAGSLRDFWGRRWNLMVTSILRPSVFIPVKSMWGQEAGVMATFVASGLMHELIFWYMTKAGPTWEVTWFFVLHGGSVILEGLGRRRGWGVKQGWLATVVTVGYVAGTGYLWFFPPVLRTGADRVAIGEAVAAVRFLEETGRSCFGRVFGGR